MLTGLAVHIYIAPQLNFVYFWELILSLGPPKNNTINILCSSAKSEYRSLAHVCADTTWILHLLQELRFSISMPIILFCDNLTATFY